MIGLLLFHLHSLFGSRLRRPAFGDLDALLDFESKASISRSQSSDLSTLTRLLRFLLPPTAGLWVKSFVLIATREFVSIRIRGFVASGSLANSGPFSVSFITDVSGVWPVSIPRNASRGFLSARVDCRRGSPSVRISPAFLVSPAIADSAPPLQTNPMPIASSSSHASTEVAISVVLGAAIGGVCAVVAAVALAAFFRRRAAQSSTYTISQPSDRRFEMTVTGLDQSFATTCLNLETNLILTAGSRTDRWLNDLDE
jgi:hypothetical protein